MLVKQTEMEWEECQIKRKYFQRYFLETFLVARNVEEQLLEKWENISFVLAVEEHYVKRANLKVLMKIIVAIVDMN